MRGFTWNNPELAHNFILETLKRVKKAVWQVIYILDGSKFTQYGFAPPIASGMSLLANRCSDFDLSLQLPRDALVLGGITYEQNYIFNQILLMCIAK